MAFYRVPTVFMVEILCALTVLSLRVHGAHSTCAALSRRCHCVSKNAVQSPCKRHGRPRRLHNDPCVRPRSSYCVVGDLTARRLCDLTASHLRSIRTPSEHRVTVFVLSMFKVRTVARRSMRPHRVQWRCHCVAAVMLAFVLRAPRRSAIFRTPLDHREDTTLV